MKSDISNINNTEILHKWLLGACVATDRQTQETNVRQWEEKIVIDDMDFSSIRMMPLFYYRNQKAGIQTKHDNRLKVIYKHWWLKTQHIVNQLKAVHETFTKNGIATVIIKGASIMEYYELRELRPMADFDLLVKPTDAAKALAILQQMQYTFTDVTGYAIKQHSELVTTFSSSLECTNKVNGTKLDLHWRLGSGCSFPLTYDLWEHLVDYCVLPGAKRPELAYEVFLIIIHAIESKRRDNLNWITDINTLNNRYDGSFWQTARKLAIREKKLVMFDYGCHLLIQYGVYAPTPEKVIVPSIHNSLIAKATRNIGPLRQLRLKIFNLNCLYPNSNFAFKSYQLLRRVKLYFIFNKIKKLNTGVTS
jgi:hypothetical protein